MGNDFVGVRIVSKGDSYETSDVVVLADGVPVTGITSINIDMQPEGSTIATIKVLVHKIDINANSETLDVCAKCNKTLDIDSQLARQDRVIDTLRRTIKDLKAEKE